MLLKILVKDCAPVDDKKSVRVVLGTRNTLQIAFCDKLAHQNTGSTLDTLSAIVLEGHILLIELDAVTEDTEYSTGSHDITIKTFLLEVSNTRKQE